jgi:hypothetical protein
MSLTNRLKINLSRNIDGLLMEHLGPICDKCYRTYDCRSGKFDQTNYIFTKQLRHADPISTHVETFINRKNKSYRF